MKYNRLNKLLIIGGAKRNVGKTMLTTRIIQKFSNEVSIVAIKIKTVREGDSFFHGKDRNPLTGLEKFRISEETHTGNDDTNRMLSAGAHRVFKIKTRKEYLSEAFSQFNEFLAADDFIICESNSLRYFVEPALYLFIKMKNSDKMKPSASDLKKYADIIIRSDGKEHDFNLNRLKVIEEKWVLD